MIRTVDELYNLYTQTKDLEVIMKYGDVIKEMCYLDTNDGLMHLKPNMYTKKYLEKAIRMCLDYYTFSPTGEVIIGDTCYDEMMKEYISLGGKLISTTETDSKTWNLVKHNAPFMVGTISKIYERDEFINYILAMKQKYGNNLILSLTPKLDGTSAVTEVNVDVEDIDDIDITDAIKIALTRKDGVVGQDITQVVTRARNIKDVLKAVSQALGHKKRIKVNGWIKNELVMDTEDFEIVREECGYANRRSATSGTMNTPSNLHNAKYISVIPLQFVSRDKDEVTCVNPWIKFTDPQQSPESIMEDVLDILKFIRMPEFPFRVDGVVIQPYAIGSLDNKLDPNTNDLLEEAIAFKINSQIGVTRAIDIYPSIGRFGKVTPMLKVLPCDVNETIVNDVSLSNIAKMMKLNIHRDEVIEVYSAGDVIPMARIPKERDYPKDADIITIQITCPYCKSHFEPVGGEYYCVNPECPRIQSGRIINFLSKLGAKGISDATIEELYEKKFVTNIIGLFDITTSNQEFINKLEAVPGWGYQSTINFVSEVERVLTTPTTLSKLVGSLGIENIGRKKCKTIFRNLPNYPDLSNGTSEYIKQLVSIKGIKGKTAEKFASFLESHDEEIKFIISKIPIEAEKECLGRIVFTGFRDAELAERIDEETDYEYDESLNKDTSILVITGTVPPEETIKEALRTKKKDKLSKIEKAYLYGTRIFSKDEFINWLDYRLNM